MRIRTTLASIGFEITVLAGLAVSNSVAQDEYVYLRQTGNSNPNGNGVYQNGASAQGGWCGAYLPFFFINDTPYTLQLSHGSMGVSCYEDDGLITSPMYAMGWTPGSFWDGIPWDFADKVHHGEVPAPTIEVVGSGVIFGAISINNFLASWEEKSLLPLNFALAPGESAYFTIAVDEQSTQNGAWFPRESNLVGDSDTLTQGCNWDAFEYEPFYTIPWTEYSGVLEGDWAFVIIGGEVCAGDANADGVIDPLDSGYIMARFGCPVGKADPQCDAADVNTDGIVDPLDVGFALSRFGDCP